MKTTRRGIFGMLGGVLGLLFMRKPIAAAFTSAPIPAKTRMVAAYGDTARLPFSSCFLEKSEGLMPGSSAYGRRIGDIFVPWSDQNLARYAYEEANDAHKDVDWYSRLPVIPCGW